jgi:hypothetical protein
MRKLQRVSAVAAVAAMALWSAPSALAQSSDLYPAGDLVSASATPMAVEGGGFNLVCTFNPGSFSIPGKGNPTGPVAVNFTTRPTFTACSFGMVIETTGTWTLSTQYGSATATIGIPTEGFTERLPGQQKYIFNSEPWKLTAVWNNGFSAPVAVSSSLFMLPSTNTYYNSGAKPLTFGTALTTLSDLTKPGSPLLLGP